jgi:hypothetical protein
MRCKMIHLSFRVQDTLEIFVLSFLGHDHVEIPWDIDSVPLFTHEKPLLDHENPLLYCNKPILDSENPRGLNFCFMHTRALIFLLLLHFALRNSNLSCAKDIEAQLYTSNSSDIILITSVILHLVARKNIVLTKRKESGPLWI